MDTFFKNKFQEVLFLSITLLAFITFYIETDIYTPSFPEMMAYFGTDENTIQRLLSMNFLGLCLSTVFFGPASDAYGRKKILCLGLFIFMLGSCGCAVTDSLSWMIFFRFAQGIGCGAIVSAGLAIIFDVYPANKSSQLVSILNGVVGGMMALAPLLGNWISLYMGWRVNFYLIAILAILVFVSNVAFIKETLAPNNRIKMNFASVFNNYRLVLCNFPFMAHTLIWCLMFSIVIVFIANLSLIFVDYLKVPKELFGYYQTVIMGAYFLGSMSGAYLIKKRGLLYTKYAGTLIYIGGILSLIFLAYLESFSPGLLITSMAMVSLGCALSGPIFFSYSMSYLQESLKGSAMSLSQCLRLFITFGLVWLAAKWFDGSTKPMSILALSCLVFSSLFYFFLYRQGRHVERV